MFEKSLLIDSANGTFAGQYAGTNTITNVSSAEQAKSAPWAGNVSGRSSPSQTTNGVDMRISRVLNGFVVHFGAAHYAGSGDVYIAADLQEVQRIILSELASRMLDEVK